jgi:DNA-binding NarL/FixJ family response regulator
VLRTAGAPAGGGARATPWARVLVVDSHELVGWGLRAVLCGQPAVERCIAVRSVEAAFAVAARYEPQLALVGVRVDRMLGLDLTRELRARLPHLTVALLGSDLDVPCPEARAAGASGLVSTAWPASEIVAAVGTLLSGQSVFPPAPRDHRRLSRRERQVLELIVTGATNREMGVQLSLSPHTIKDHTLSLYRKLEARNRAEAVHRAQRLGLVA